jgi:hypothetical protein
MGRIPLDRDEKISAARDDLENKVFDGLDELLELLLNVDSSVYLDLDWEGLIDFVDNVWVKNFVGRDRP